jgi:hypothetical protein
MDNIMAWIAVSVKKIRCPPLGVRHRWVKQPVVALLLLGVVIFGFFWVASLMDSRHSFLIRVILNFGLFQDVAQAITGSVRH